MANPQPNTYFTIQGYDTTIEDIVVTTLTIGSTTVTATADELNILDGVTSTAAELNLNDNQAAGADFTINAEDSDTITVNVQLNDAAGTAMATACLVHFWLASDTAGLDPTTAATSLAAGTDGAMQEFVANGSGILISEADGDIDVVIGDTGTTTYYLAIGFANGSFAVSSAITFA